MAKAILTTKVDPTYDDLPEQRYHFPRTYLRQMQAALGDFVIYYEPRRSSGALSSRGGRQSYFATARITEIVPDRGLPDHYYALMDSYLDFARPVPFRADGFYYETAIQREDGETSKGAFGRSVRALPDREYDAIVQAAFAPILARPEATLDAAQELVRFRHRGLAEEQASFERPIVERVVNRPFRDAAFSGTIKTAYGDTCAFTGLKIINGGGRSEVQAAHIKPVASGGQDSLRNGIALCGTVLLAAGQVPDPVARLLNPDRRLLGPVRQDATPHPQFLRWHRENVFKG
jgi:putative restriction endonuclease